MYPLSVCKISSCTYSNGSLAENLNSGEYDIHVHVYIIVTAVTVPPGVHKQVPCARKVPQMANRGSLVLEIKVWTVE